MVEIHLLLLQRFSNGKWDAVFTDSNYPAIQSERAKRINQGALWGDFAIVPYKNAGVDIKDFLNRINRYVQEIRSNLRKTGTRLRKIKQ